MLNIFTIQNMPLVMDPDQIWHNGFLNISADEKAGDYFVIGAFRVKYCYK